MGGGYTLITGASSGLGKATARLLSRERNLILSGRDEARLMAVREACAANGHEAVAFSYDLAKADAVGAALSAFLKERALPVEAFAHFAGMTEVLPIAKTKYHVGLEVMNVNYFSATEIISALLKKRVNGENLANILLVTSIVVEGGKKYQPHYVASKGALAALIPALARELAPQVRVNGLAPGSFMTRITQTTFADSAAGEAWRPATLLAPGTPADLAKVARFLLSEESGYVTGQVINVDGGERFPTW